MIVLITGASRGLGREMAMRFAERGAKLVLAARDEEPLRAVAREVAKHTEVLVVSGDVSQCAEALAKRALERFGHVDVLINNASTVGPSPMPRLADLDWRDFERVLRVNVLAPMHLTQLLLPGMRERGHGTIVNVTSDAAVNAYPGWGGYGTSKAALEHASRILAAELEGSGVRVYCVDPGDMNTRMHEEAEPGVDLSHLPPPSVPAPFFVDLVERETAAFGRFEAQRAPARVQPGDALMPVVWR